MRKKWIALTLTLAMVLSLLPVSALAEGGAACPHHPEHTPECGYLAAVEGQECTHVCGDGCQTVTTDCTHAHDPLCYSDGVLPAEGEEKAADACPHVCSEETGCVTRVPGCSHTHDDSCGFVEAVEGQPCGFVCNICSESGVEPCPHGSAPDSCGICPVQALIDALPDTVTENAAALLAEAETAMSALTEAERAQLELTRYTALAALLAQGDRVITAWAWIDEEEVLDEETGGLALPGASEETPAFFEDVTFLLPCEIRATVEGAEEILTLDGWLCGDYPMEMGAGSGEYRFEAVLPEGYVLGEGVKALTVPVLLGGGAMWATAKNISYRSCDSNGKNWTDATCASATVVASGSTSWSNGWYVVNSNVTIGSRVTVSGSVNLILMDGYTLTVKGGIGINSGNSLTIWGQSGGSGSLKVENIDKRNAGIGGTIDNDAGNITINGGIITAGAGLYAAAIGGAPDTKCGKIVINGGWVNATGNDSAAIGGGWNVSGGSITINGGTIYAYGGTLNSAGIGTGPYSSGYLITINGGNINATGGGGDAKGTAIGGGYSSSGTIKITGGMVDATGASAGGAVIGNRKDADASQSSVAISGGIVTCTVNGMPWNGGVGLGANTVAITGGIVDASYSSGTTMNNCVLNYKVYGTFTLKQSYTLQSNKKLTIPSGTTLKISSGVTLTNNGAVYVDGTLSGSVGGNVYYPLTVNSGTAGGNTSNYNSKNYGRANGTITLTPDTAPDGKAFSKWESGQVTVSANNQFQMPAKAVTVTALFGDIVASVTVGQTLTNYASLTEAFAFANGKAAEITLLKDALSSDPLTISGGDITFEGGNNTMLGCITISGGTFHFKSGTLKPATNGIIVSGGTLDFQGGTIEGDYYGWSVQITSGEANISGGTLHDISATGSGRLNVSGGEISCLSVDGATTALSGGSFGEINTTGKVSALLSSGYAYYLDGSWVDATHGDNGTFLSGGRESIQILSVPVKITTQPVDTSLTYSESKFLSVTAEGTGVTYQWYVSGTAIDSATGSSLSLSTLNAGSYQLFCRVSCNGYDLDSNTVTVTVGKATVTTPSVPGKVYTGSLQTGEVPGSTLYTVTKNQGGTDADSYEVILALTDPNNYQWDSAGGKTTFRITMADNSWTKEPGISGWIYGDAPSAPTGAAKFGTLKVEYTSDGSAYSETAPTNAGSYKARFTVAETANFAGLTRELDFTIRPKAITVTFTPGGGTYGGTITPAAAAAKDPVGSDQVPVTLTYTGKANDGTDHSSTTAPSKAGSYTVTASISDSNYRLTGTITAEFVIGRATVPTPSVPGKVYTGSVQTGEVPASTLYTVTKNQGGTNADSYEVILTLTDPNNYQWDSAGGKTTFRITMATSNPWTTEPAISGWIYGDTPSTPTGAAKFGTVTVTYISKEGTPAYYGETPPTKAGDYMAVFSVAETPNYIGKQEVKDFTISLRPLTLTVTVKEKAFDGTTDAEIDTVTPKGIVSGDRVQVLNGTPTFACANAGTGIPVSLTRFSLEGADADNYSLVQPTGVTGTIRASQRYLNLEGNGDFAGQTEVWLDGEAYPIRRDTGAYVALPVTGELLTIYTYKQGSSSGTHENYPTGMAVYRVTRADSGATLARISEFDDLLQYSGCSIRITGQQGIRMITSLTRENKKALTGAGLAGCTLEEYGTVVLWAKDLGGASLTLANGKSNYAYKKGVADPVFAATGSLTQYTNVLVWESLTGEQLGQDLVMRPYIILRDAGGKTVTLYGGCVTRSIGYIACRNRATYSPGTPAYRFVWDIIHAVYGTQFDSEYKG